MEIILMVLRSNIFLNFKSNIIRNYSVIYEYCRHGSLNKLVKTINTIPENLLKMISFQVLIALDYYHKKTGNCYNCLTPSNVLIDGNFEMKVK